MEYFVIVLVIAVALAPLSHFVPSKHQRKVARLRESAAVQGLFVEFRNLPDGGGAGASRRVARQQHGNIIYYGKRLPPLRSGSAERGSWTCDEEGWRGVRHHTAVPEVLAELPPQVLAASVDEGSCGIYWQEAGGEAELADLVRVLNSWSGQLRP
jgi:hypothetical protein